MIIHYNNGKAEKLLRNVIGVQIVDKTKPATVVFENGSEITVNIDNIEMILDNDISSRWKNALKYMPEDYIKNPDINVIKVIATDGEDTWMQTRKKNLKTKKWYWFQPSQTIMAWQFKPTPPPMPKRRQNE